MSTTYTPVEYAEGLVRHHGLLEASQIARHMITLSDRTAAILIATVVDQADFDRELAVMAFSGPHSDANADRWGEDVAAQIRAERPEGELFSPVTQTRRVPISIL